MLHFFTVLIQLYFVYFIFTNEFSFNSFLYIILFFIIPFITDGIGHIIEKNFGLVLIASKLKKSTNSAGANYFENFLFKIILFLETFLFIKIIK